MFKSGQVVYYYSKNLKATVRGNLIPYSIDDGDERGTISIV